MKLVITICKNGYTIDAQYQDSEDQDEIYICKDFCDLFYQVRDLCGEFGSSRDEERIHIIKCPGDDHPDYTKEHGEALELLTKNTHDEEWD